MARWRRGGTPRGALLHNDAARFVDVSHGSGANISLRGNGCCRRRPERRRAHRPLRHRSRLRRAALEPRRRNVHRGRPGGRHHDLRLAQRAPRSGRERRRPPRPLRGWLRRHQQPRTGRRRRLPEQLPPTRDRLYLNLGPDANGRSRFREVARQRGRAEQVDHGLGVVFTDYNGDGRLDLYVANDTDPNRLLENVPAAGRSASGCRSAPRNEVVADSQAGMGVASADFNRDLGQTCS